MGPAISVTNLRRTFGTFKALDGVSLQVERGAMVALVGPSGSGKSTLLRHLSGLIAADVGSGPVQVLGETVQENGRINPSIRAIRARIGFVFQQFNLVGRLSLLHNVCAGLLSGVPIYRSFFRVFTRKEKMKAMEALEQVGMAQYAMQRASTLSGGQQQRGAIARAIVQRAEVILADEPIASLDPESSRRVMELLTDLNREKGTTVLVSLHQVDFAFRCCPHGIALKSGQVCCKGTMSSFTLPRLKEIYGEKFGEAGLDDGRALRPELEGAELPVGAIQRARSVPLAGLDAEARV